MNDTVIKNFAVAARRQLLDDVRLQMKRWAIDEDCGVPATADTLQGDILTPQQRRQRAELLALCKAKGEDQLAEQAAYTWFNRFLAIRFMELHDYLPCGLRFFSSPDGSFDPQVLKEALQADIEGVDRARVAELVRSSDDEALFRYLFIAQCNELASCMPAVFERVGSAMELLLPESLLREGSVLDHMVSDIPEDDWREGVEIVGWMYQYYVSERKDEVFVSFKKGKKAEKEAIAPATQLFTPNWIVRYLVENSLGRLWMLNHPDSGLKDRMKYFIAPDAEAHEEFKRVSSPEEITVCDPACGSGHILVYAFELLAAMYEESGYMRRDIPRAIIENNLSGMEIDPRAGSLASFALTMKALEMDSRFLRRGVQPDIKVLEPVSFVEEELELVPEIAGRKGLLDAVEHMDECGSLYEPEEEDLAALKNAADRLSSEASDLFADSAMEKIGAALADCEALARKFDVVVANPPYMGSSNMSKWLASWTKKHYPDSKRDLCTCFIECGFTLVNSKGYSSLVTMQSWMFLASFEELRKQIFGNRTIVAMMHIGARGFDSIGGEVVSTTATVLLNDKQPIEGAYIRLVDDAGEDAKSLKAREAIANPDCGWFYRRNALDFATIPGSPIAYWISIRFKDLMSSNSILNFGRAYEGIKTGNNDLFLRYWFEVELCMTNVLTGLPSSKWWRTSKAGEYRKWYGSHYAVTNFENYGEAIRLSGHGAISSSEPLGMPAITWIRISSGRLSFRYLPKGYISNMAGLCFYPDRLADPLILLAALNSSITQIELEILNPSMSYPPGTINSLSVLLDISPVEIAKIKEIVGCVLKLSKSDWDACEMSWDFEAHPLATFRREERSMVGYIVAIAHKSSISMLSHNIEKRLSDSDCGWRGRRVDVSTSLLEELDLISEVKDRLAIFQVDYCSDVAGFRTLYSALIESRAEVFRGDRSDSNNAFDKLDLTIAAVVRIDNDNIGEIEIGFGAKSNSLRILNQNDFEKCVWDARSDSFTTGLKANVIAVDCAYLLMCGRKNTD